MPSPAQPVRSKALQVCSYYMGTPLYQHLFDQLEDQGYQHDILYYGPTGPRPEKTRSNLIVSQAYPSVARLAFFLKHRLVYADLRGLIDPDQYYMTHAHSLVSNGFISYRLKQDHHIPYITAVRNADIYYLLRYWPHLIPLTQRILASAEHVVFLSPSYRDLVLKRYVAKADRDHVADRALVIPNGIDARFLSAAAPRASLPASPIKLLFVGRVDDPNKNVRTIIRACDALEASGHPVELTLVGRFEKRLFKATFPERAYIRLLGKMDAEGVRDVMKQQHILVMPSKFETFGLVYAEAMSQGLPVVYTQGQGFDGQFHEGEVGFHVTYDDPRQIVDRVRAIMADYDAFSERARAGASRFDWARVAESYGEVYESLRPTE